MNDAKKFGLNAFKQAALALFIEMRSKVGLRDILKNSGWLFFDKGIRALLGLFVGAWVAKHLGPSQFGKSSISHLVGVLAGISSA